MISWWKDAQRRAPGMSRIRLFVSWKICRGLVRLFFRAFYGLRADGTGLVPRTGPILYVANHQSHYDPPAIGCVLKDRPCAFLARSTLFDFKPFGALIRFFNAVPLDRQGRGTSAFRTSLEELDAGRCLLLFPEGTRCPDGRIAEFKPGFVLLVRRSQAAVVPIAIEGAYDAWPCTRKHPRLRGRIRVSVCPPMTSAECRDLEPAELIARIRSTIAARCEELRAELTAT